MADRDQPGEPRQQVQPEDGDRRDEDVVDHQHGLVAGVEHERPREEDEQEGDVDRAVQVRLEDPLLIPV